MAVCRCKMLLFYYHSQVFHVLFTQIPSCCLGGKDLALLAPAVQNFMENFKLEMKMLNSLMMDQKNTGVCGAGYS